MNNEMRPGRSFVISVSANRKVPMHKLSLSALDL